MKAFLAGLLVAASMCSTGAVFAAEPEDGAYQDPPRPKYYEITGRVDGRDFRAHRFGGTNLAGADFSACLLVRADFTGCDLRHAKFAGSDLRNAILAGTRLRMTDFRGADLRGVDFRSSIIDKPLFDGAAFDTTTRWPLGFNPLRWGARLIPSVSVRAERP